MSDFGSEPIEGGFNAISKEYKSSHSIENYIRLRREHPHEEIEIATTGGIEFLFKFEAELRSLGLEPDLIAGVMDANASDQADVSLFLLEKLVERERLKDSGATHVVSRKKSVSDNIINYIIAVALDALSWNDNLEITRELIVLIKHQLGTLRSQFDAELETRTNKSNATWVAAQLLAMGITPTYRIIGRTFGVQASTVMRWFPNGDFMSESERLVPLVRDLVPSIRKSAEDWRNTRDTTKKS